MCFLFNRIIWITINFDTICINHADYFSLLHIGPSLQLLLHVSNTLRALQKHLCLDPFYVGIHGAIILFYRLIAIQNTLSILLEITMLNSSLADLVEFFFCLSVDLVSCGNFLRSRNSLPTEELISHVKEITSSRRMRLFLAVILCYSYFLFIYFLRT